MRRATCSARTFRSPVSQTFQNEVTPANFSNPALVNIGRPFPTPVPNKPTTTAALNAVTPAPTIIGHEFSNLTPYAQSYGLNIERALTNTIVLEIGYAGSRGIHIPVFYNINEVLPGSGTIASRRLDPAVEQHPEHQHCPVPQLVELQWHAGHRPTSVSLMARIFWSVIPSASRSITALRRRAAAERWAIRRPTPTSRRAVVRPATTHATGVVFSTVYESPFGRGRKYLTGGIGAWILGGWQTTGIVTATTGRPFSVTLQNGVNNGAPSWPNRIASGRLDNPTTDRWFDINAFVAPSPNTYGNASAWTPLRAGQFQRRRLAGQVVQSDREGTLPVPLRGVQSVQHAVFRFPERQHRKSERRVDPVDDRRQPQSSGSAQARILRIVSRRIVNGWPRDISPRPPFLAPRVAERAGERLSPARDFITLVGGSGQFGMDLISWQVEAGSCAAVKS
jgi:hypothetical protein